MKASSNDLRFWFYIVVGALALYLLLAAYFMARPPGLLFTFVLVPAIIVAVAIGVALDARRYNLGAGIATALILGFVEYSVIFLPPQMFAEVIECTITGDESAVTTGLFKNSKTQNLKYIYTDYGSEGEPFKNVDSMAFFKTNSLTVQGLAKKHHGNRVRMKVYGIRFSLLSMTRNVIYIEPIETKR